MERRQRSEPDQKGSQGLEDTLWGCHPAPGTLPGLQKAGSGVTSESCSRKRWAHLIKFLLLMPMGTWCQSQVGGSEAKEERKGSEQRAERCASSLPRFVFPGQSTCDLESDLPWSLGVSRFSSVDFSELLTFFRFQFLYILKMILIVLLALTRKEVSCVKCLAQGLNQGKCSEWLSSPPCPVGLQSLAAESWPNIAATCFLIPQASKGSRYTETKDKQILVFYSCEAKLRWPASRTR